MTDILLIIIICLIITSFGFRELSKDGDVTISSIPQIIFYTFVYGLGLIVLSLPLIAIVLGWLYFVGAL